MVKITKRQLRRIIREQVEDENMAGRDIKLGLGGKAGGTYQHAQATVGATDNLDAAIKQMLQAYAPNEVIEELQAIIEDINTGVLK